ncbi:MAG: twin-arginine translocase subunit TatC [Planctomycetota bacterium]|nr:twin-arginine translocase subunit TatC [Planctomycetota bacterium]
MSDGNPALESDPEAPAARGGENGSAQDLVPAPAQAPLSKEAADAGAAPKPAAKPEPVPAARPKAPAPPPAKRSRAPEPDPEEDGPRMGFLDHLMELRKRLVSAIAAIVLMTVLSLFFHKPVFDFLRWPLDQVNASFRDDPELRRMLTDTRLPPDIRGEIREAVPDDAQYALVLDAFYDRDLFDADGFPVTDPAFRKRLKLLDINATAPVVQQISVNPLGLMMILMKISVYAGLLLSSPIVLYELWAFISPGLRDNERSAIRPVLAGGIFCFLVGAGFCYRIVFPLTIQFLVWFDVYLGYLPMYTPEEYMNLLLTFMLLFGAIFEIPLVSAVLARLKVLHPSVLTRYWRYVTLACFILGSLLSPGSDMISMVLMSGSLLFLYVVSIVLTRLVYPKD